MCQFRRDHSNLDENLQSYSQSIFIHSSNKNNFVRQFLYVNVYVYIYMTIYELFLIFKLNFQLKIFVKKQPTRENDEFNINYV